MSSNNKSLDKVTLSYKGLSVTFRNYTDEGISIDYPNQNEVKEDSQGEFITEKNPAIKRADILFNLSVTEGDFNTANRMFDLFQESNDGSKMTMSGRRGGNPTIELKSNDVRWLFPPRLSGMGTAEAPGITAKVACKNMTQKMR